MSVRFVLIAFVAGIAAVVQLGSPFAQAQSQHAAEQNQRIIEIRKLAQANDWLAIQAMVDAAKAAARSLTQGDVAFGDALELERELLELQGHADVALPLAKAAVAARKAANPPEDMLLARSLLSLSRIADKNNDGKLGETASAELLEAFKRVFGPDDIRRADVLENFAKIAQTVNQRRVALERYQEAYAIRTLRPAAARLAAADTASQIALLLLAFGDLEGADALLTQTIMLAREETEAASSPDQRAAAAQQWIGAVGTQAGVAARSHRYDAADAIIAAARPAAKYASVPEFLDFYSCDVRRRRLVEAGEWAKALEEMRACLKTVQNLSGAPSFGSAMQASFLLQIADLELVLNDPAAAERDANSALKIYASASTSQSSNLANSYLLLARIKAAQKLTVQSQNYLTGALTILKNQRSEVRVLFATNRAPHPDLAGRYSITAAPRGQLTLGEALVLVPGFLESVDKTLQSLGTATILDRLLVADVKTVSANEWQRQGEAMARAAKVYPGTALVFVHGYGTTFENGLARAGQIARDIAFDGPMYHFAWPSQGKTVEQPVAYGIDQRNAAQSITEMVDFLAAVGRTSGVERIHIIAHSMGNAIILPALENIRRTPEHASLAAKLGEVVFASPDVDADQFKRDASVLNGLHMTLYASAYDKAMWVSWGANVFSKRAGFVGWGLLSSGAPVVAKGVDSIDASKAGTDWFSANHDVYSANPLVTNDLRKLFQSGVRPPHERSPNVLIEGGTRDQRYWLFQTPAR